MKADICIRKCLWFCSLLAFVLPLKAVADNPYNWSNWEADLEKANWQVGYNSYTVCDAGECESSYGSSTWDDYTWAESNIRLRFSTDGSESTTWRNELRFASGFWRNTTKSMTARLRFWHDQTTSDGFTVMQLHKEDAAGPVARLEIIDEDFYQVKWRSDATCSSSSSSCFHEQVFTASPRGWQVAQIAVRAGFTTVKVNGQSRTFEHKQRWPTGNDYYWKTGIYLQESGSVNTIYSYIVW